ncbi:uncharacterized protein [Miscanthus floridulus]|uniref:uncharacterized protein n=1 Tax=Miscanthus floridulus TaxID=154761 RepID=UPI003459A0A1
METAVQQIAPFLEDTSNDAPRFIYFEGWDGLGASTVLRAIAEQPALSLREKFEKIIHIDCSVWKSRRALQRVIVDEIKLTQQLAADFDRQDEKEDFSGVDQGSRAEIRDITGVIGRYLVQYRCLVIFHNGSSNTVDLASFGIPMLELLGTKMAYLEEEAREIALHMHKLGLGVTPKIATECCLYLLSLNNQAKKMIDYNWATHASCYWNGLKWCWVERCPKLDIVFATNYYWRCFSQMEIFWAAHLLMARSIWSRPRNPRLDASDLSFTQLRAIHLHFCPRLRYVLPMASNNTLSKVETLHIHCCGDLRQVFHMEQEFLEKIEALHEKGMLEFSNLKSLHLYELQSLQQICEAKMFAPKLETIYIRGCWSLRHLLATGSRFREDGRLVAVDCEKDWWDKLEWDGMESCHHATLFEPSHSKYYKRRHLRGTVLR